MGQRSSVGGRALMMVFFPLRSERQRPNCSRPGHKESGHRRENWQAPRRTHPRLKEARPKKAYHRERD